jgi:mRNA interferase RelE/StbE
MWRIIHKRQFYRELARLPKKLRQRIEEIAFGDNIKLDPFLDGQVQKLKGYREYYKIRIGNYRVGLKLDKEKRTIEFCRVLHRREIYRKFP